MGRLLVLKEELTSQKGESLVSGFYVMFILAIMLFVFVEVASYSMAVWKLYGACGETLELMKGENGVDSRLELSFYQLVKSLNLEHLNIQMQGTPKQVQRGDKIEIVAWGTYPIQSLRPFGEELRLPFKIKLTGLAHTYIRQGG